MIEALAALHLFLQEPTILQTRSRARYHYRVKKPKPQFLTVPRVEILKVRIDGFEQDWQQRICLYDARWTTDDSLQCTW